MTHNKLIKQAKIHMAEQCPVCLYTTNNCADDEQVYIDRFVETQCTCPVFRLHTSPMPATKKELRLRSEQNG